MHLPVLDATFLHIPKVAGCSIEKALAQYADFDIDTLYNTNYYNYNYKINYQHAFPHELQLKSFVFTFVRNPWDRVVSYYHHLLRLNLFTEQLPFKEFILYWKNLRQLNSYIQTDDVEFFMAPASNWTRSVHYVGRYESLQEDFSIVCQRLNIEILALPNTNKTKHRHYTNYFNTETKNLIYDYYYTDISLFNYQFTYGR